ncbi:hypothetical protein [Ornithinimicrobium kibberense]
MTVPPLCTDPTPPAGPGPRHPVDHTTRSVHSGQRLSWRPDNVVCGL